MSFYILELSIIPGEYKKTDLYIYNNLEKIQRRLVEDLETGLGCYYAAWYGETITLHIYENYEYVTSIDLHPYISIETEKYPYIYFDPDGEVIALTNEEELVGRGDPEYDDYFVNILNGYDNGFGDKDGINEVVGAYVNISDIPEIDEDKKLLDKNEVFSLMEYPDKVFHYGYNDLEYNDDIFETSDQSEMMSTDE